MVRDIVRKTQSTAILGKYNHFCPFMALGTSIKGEAKHR